MFDSVLGSPVCRSFKIPFLEKQPFLLNPPKETVGKLHLHCLADWSISVPSARDEIFTGNMLQHWDECMDWVSQKVSL